MIIDVLGYAVEDNIETLKACSLVCRGWAHHTRRHLLRTMVIFHTPVGILHKYNRLFADLRTLTFIARYTQSIHLESLGVMQQISIHYVEYMAERHNSASFWRTAPSFNHVRKLNLKSLSTNIRFTEDVVRLAMLFPNVTTLTLDSCCFNNISHLLSFIAIFPNLSRLEVLYLIWPPSEITAISSDPPPGSARPDFHKLTHLEVSLTMSDIEGEACNQIARLLQRPLEELILRLPAHTHTLFPHAGPLSGMSVPALTISWPSYGPPLNAGCSTQLLLCSGGFADAAVSDHRGFLQLPSNSGSAVTANIRI